MIMKKENFLTVSDKKLFFDLSRLFQRTMQSNIFEKGEEFPFPLSIRRASRI